MEKGGKPDLTVAIVAQGAMGAGLAARLTAHGVRVLTDLSGRSEASRARAAAAGVEPVSAGELMAADLLLSVVPPADAVSTAVRLALALAGADRKPLYVDCNAVSLGTLAQVAETVRAAGAPFADAGIIGLPPRPDGYTPVIYASGEAAGPLLTLNDYGLTVRRLEGPAGAASALKMAYAGITKGFAAVLAAMTSAALRAGAAEALLAELADSRPAFLADFHRLAGSDDGGMFAKAWRWEPEMREIADFAGEDPAARALYEAVAGIFGDMAADYQRGGPATSALAELARR